MHVVTGKGDFKVKEGRFRLDISQKFFGVRVVRALEHGVQGSLGFTITGNIQGQFGWVLSNTI